MFQKFKSALLFAIIVQLILLAQSHTTEKGNDPQIAIVYALKKHGKWKINFRKCKNSV
jgi:hypothetical protein